MFSFSPKQYVLDPLDKGKNLFDIIINSIWNLGLEM